MNDDPMKVAEKCICALADFINEIEEKIITLCHDDTVKKALLDRIVMSMGWDRCPIQRCIKCNRVNPTKHLKYSVIDESYTCDNENRCNHYRERELRKNHTHLYSLIKKDRRLVGCLRYSGLFYVEDIENLTDDTLMKIKGLGRKGLTNLRKYIAEYRSLDKNENDEDIK